MNALAFLSFNPKRKPKWERHGSAGARCPDSTALYLSGDVSDTIARKRDDLPERTSCPSGCSAFPSLRLLSAVAGHGSNQKLAESMLGAPNRTAAGLSLARPNLILNNTLKSPAAGAWLLRHHRFRCAKEIHSPSLDFDHFATRQKPKAGKLLAKPHSALLHLRVAVTD